MPLQKQNLNVSFSKGIDTKTDSKQVVPGKLLVLENGVFTAPGKIIKRNGHVKLADITDANALATFNDEILAISTTEVSSLNEDSNTLTPKGPIAFADVHLNQIVAKNTQQTVQDMSVNDMGIKVYAYEDSDGGARYTVLDTATQNHIINNVSLSSIASVPKIISIKNLTYIFYIDNNSLRYRTISANSPETITAPIPFESVAVGSVFDVCVIGNRIFIFYVTSSNRPGITYIDFNGSTSISSVIIPDTVTGTITCFADVASNQVYSSYYNGTDVRYIKIDYNLAILQPATTVETIANVVTITGAVSSGTGQLFYTISSTPTYNYLIRTAPIVAGVVGAPIAFIRSAGLGTKAFITNGSVYVIGLYDSGLGEQLSTDTGAPQNKYIIFDSEGHSVGKLLAEPNTAGSLPLKDTLPSVVSSDNNEFFIPVLINLAISGFAFSLNQALAEITLTFGFIPTKVQLGDNLHIAAGAQLFAYDGTSVVEHGFNFYPEKATVTNTAQGGGINPGIREYEFTYEWNDSQGQLHQSATSVPLEVNTTTFTGIPLGITGNFSANSTTIVVSSATNLFVGQVITDVTTPASLQANTTIIKIVGNTITIDLPTVAGGSGDTLDSKYVISNSFAIPTLRLSQKTGVNVVIYRTAADGVNYFRVGSVPNDPTVDVVLFTDTTSDYLLAFNEQLYTNGGAVDNIAVPATGIITQYQNRLIAIPSENRYQIMYSKQTGRSVGSALLSPVQFSATSFYINYDQRGGPGSMVFPLDDKLIIFKENTAFFMYGQGPAPNGTNNDFSVPQLITNDCGCIDPVSVINMPTGLMFKSSKGVYQLNRSLQTTYIGADVEAFNQYGISSTQLIPSTNQVRFSLIGISSVLMYDYFMGQWSVFTGLNTVDSIIADNLYTYLDRTYNMLLQEAPGVFTDNNQPIKIKIVTSWLSFVGFQGFQRVYKMLLDADYFSPHLLNIRLAYDFNPNPTQQIQINPSSFVQFPYGSSFTYGSTSPYGDEAPQTYQYGLNNQTQKCQSIQVTIEEVPLLPYKQGLSLSAIGFEVGAKKGLYKLPSSRSSG